MPEFTSRREVVKSLGGIGLTLPFLKHSRASAQVVQEADEKIIFVVAAAGGANLLDCFLPIVRQTNAPVALNAYNETELDRANGQLRCVKDIDYKLGSPVGPKYSMVDFLKRHESDTAVITQQCTSVNHLVASERALTGNNANFSRTVMEAVSEKYGKRHLFANVNMALGAYAVDGKDPSLPSYARSVTVGDAMLFPLSTHGFKGIKNVPSADLLHRARRVRGELEKHSTYLQRFEAAPVLQNYLRNRNGIKELESSQLITRLMLIDELRQGIPLSEYGLQASDEIGVLQDKFIGLGTDPFHAQAALGFLLAKYGISCAITLSLSDGVLFSGPESNRRMDNLPLAFDWSHNNHRGAQNTMWRRILQVVDQLISLLKAEDYLGDPSKGKIWDRSLIYIATEFGRSKFTQHESTRGSAHDLNNGHIIISPLIRGGRVFGGIDSLTGNTYGFDPTTGSARRDRNMNEKDTYSLICHALGVDFQGRVAMPGIVRA